MIGGAQGAFGQSRGGEGMLIVPGRNDPQRIGPYAVLRKVGGGGMGVVYLGVAGDQVPAAVKVIRPEYAEDPGFRRRFAQEARSSARVSGPGVAEVLAHGLNAAPPWLATEFVAGPSLGDAVRKRMPVDVAPLGALLAAALRRIHDKSVVHRDLKPSNVMLGAAGPVIIDFGIARAYEDTRLTGTGAIGTSGYIAPEYLGHGHFDTRSDVFALGAVLAFAALGHSPYGDGHPAAVNVRVLSQEPDLAGLDPALGDLLRACLAREPADRPTGRPWRDWRAPCPACPAVISGGPRADSPGRSPAVSARSTVSSPTTSRRRRTPAGADSTKRGPGRRDSGPWHPPRPRPRGRPDPPGRPRHHRADVPLRRARTSPRSIPPPLARDPACPVGASCWVSRRCRRPG